MELKTISHNILNKVLDKNIRIIYNDHVSIFDKIFQKLDYYILSESNKLSTCFYYDLKIINNYLPYINNLKSINRKFQLSNLVFFHDYCLPQFKKEDKIILNNTLRNTQKVVFTKSHYENWALDTNSTMFIKYGIPQPSIDVWKSKTEDVLILNLRNNAQLTTLFQHIKNQYPNTDIINDVNSFNLEDIYRKISQYKIVIDIDSVINCLVSTVCGCVTLNNQAFDSNISSNIQIMDFRTILVLIKKILESETKPMITENISYILKEYNFNSFETNIDKLVKRIKSEPFVI